MPLLPKERIIREIIEGLAYLRHRATRFREVDSERLVIEIHELSRAIERKGVIKDEYIERLSSLVEILRRRGVRMPSRLIKATKQLSSGYSQAKLMISLKKTIIKEIAERKKRKERLNIVLMFGSGASHPSPSDIPTVNEMLEYLVENLPPTEIPFASKVKEWATRDGVNIEDILTAGYLGTLLVSKPIVNKLVGEIIYRELGEQVAELREREYVFSFQDLVNRVFSMVSGMMAKADSNVVHESVAKLIKNLKDDEVLEFSVLTTNYDVCIEKAFRKHDLQYNYLGIHEGEGIPIVKIHGSMNWFYCEGCQSVITYSIKELQAFKKMFPTSGSCQKCGTPTSLFMVPPIAYKYVMFPPLIDMASWHEHT